MKGTFFPFPMEGVKEEAIGFQSLGDRPSLHCCFHYTNGQWHFPSKCPKRRGSTYNTTT